MIGFHELGTLQLFVLQALSHDGEVPLSTLVATFPAGKRPHPSTLCTVLKRLERRGLVARRRAPNGFRYRATHPFAALREQMLNDLVTRLFDHPDQALDALHGAHPRLPGPRVPRHLLED